MEDFNWILFWSAISAVGALLGGVAALFYFVWTIKLVRATQSSILLSNKQLLILEGQIKEQQKKQKMDEQLYRYKMISEFENGNDSCRIKMVKKSNNHPGFVNVFSSTTLDGSYWGRRFYPDASPEYPQTDSIQFSTKWGAVQKVKQLFRYVYRTELMNDDGSLHSGK